MKISKQALVETYSSYGMVDENSPPHIGIDNTYDAILPKTQAGRLEAVRMLRNGMTLDTSMRYWVR